MRPCSPCSNQLSEPLFSSGCGPDRHTGSWDCWSSSSSCPQAPDTHIVEISAPRKRVWTHQEDRIDCEDQMKGMTRQVYKPATCLHMNRPFLSPSPPTFFLFFFLFFPLLLLLKQPQSLPLPAFRSSSKYPITLSHTPNTLSNLL